jgi:hypothetical protein
MNADIQTPDEMEPFERVVYEIDRTETEPNRHLSIQIDNYVQQMVRAAQDSGQAASVTIKLVAKRKGEMIELTGNATAKLPKPAAGTVRLYADEFGNLFDHNPQHATSALPGVDVKTPKRQRAQVETPINAKKE